MTFTMSTPKMLSANRPQRGEVWQVQFDPSVGAEIRKTRPAVVMNAASVGRLALCIVVPITDWKPIYAAASWFVHLMPSSANGLQKESGADTFQVKSVSEDRFVQRIGTLPQQQVDTIAKAISICVGYIGNTSTSP